MVEKIIGLMSQNRFTGEECGQFQADALSLGAAPDSHGRYFLK
jgi:hypothetical protein